jgi:hypothetical protein
VDRVESILGIKSDVNPARILVEDRSHRVSGKLKTRAARDANLDRPWRAVGLGRWKGRARRRRLEVGGESFLELFCRYH